MRAWRTAVLFAMGLQFVCIPASAFAQEVTPEGESLFRGRCAACHGTEPGGSRIGPHLANVMGRAAASVEGARYSAALQASGIVWDEQTLDSFLADPRRAVPGTTMAVRLPDAAQRAAIIAYLRSLTGDES